MFLTVIATLAFCSSGWMAIILLGWNRKKLVADLMRGLKKTRLGPYIGNVDRSVESVWTSDSMKICHPAPQPPYVDGETCRLSNSCRYNMPGITAEKDEFTNLVEELEEKSSSKIIFINHRSKPGGFGGLNLDILSNTDTLSQKDAVKMIDILRDLPNDQNLDIILNTTGGSMTAAEVIINALTNHKGKIRVYVPHHALSAGLLLALAADEIYLEKNAFVSPIDPQLIGFSAASIIKYADQYGHISTGWVGDIMKLASGQAKSANNRMNFLLKKMLVDNYTSDDIEIISDELASGKYNHDKPLFYNDLKMYLDNVHDGIPNDIYKLYQLHNKSLCR